VRNEMLNSALYMDVPLSAHWLPSEVATSTASSVREATPSWR
jgi:hypothetical protein